MDEPKDSHLLVRVNADTKAKAREMARIEKTDLSKEVNKLLRRMARKLDRIKSNE